jgi:hypothetical protein
MPSPKRLLVVGCILSVLANACTSRRVLVAQKPPEHFEVIGPASGTGCGVLLGWIFPTIPMRTNSRIDRAARNAVDPMDGQLIDVSVTEWVVPFVFGCVVCTTVSGTEIVHR